MSTRAANMLLTMTMTMTMTMRTSTIMNTQILMPMADAAAMSMRRMLRPAV